MDDGRFMVGVEIKRRKGGRVVCVVAVWVRLLPLWKKALHVSKSK